MITGVVTARSDFLGHRDQLGGVLGAFDDQRELVAAQPSRWYRLRAIGRASRAATVCNTRSPAPCPRVSLICLKRSRSKNMTPTKRAVAPRPRNGLRQPVAEHGAVGQPGQHIVLARETPGAPRLACAGSRCRSHRARRKCWPPSRAADRPAPDRRNPLPTANNMSAPTTDSASAQRKVGR